MPKAELLFGFSKTEYPEQFAEIYKYGQEVTRKTFLSKIVTKDQFELERDAKSKTESGEIISRMKYFKIKHPDFPGKIAWASVYDEFVCHIFTERE